MLIGWDVAPFDPSKYDLLLKKIYRSWRIYRPHRPAIGFGSSSQVWLHQTEAHWINDLLLSWSSNRKEIELLSHFLPITGDFEERQRTVFNIKMYQKLILWISRSNSHILPGIFCLRHFWFFSLFHLVSRVRRRFCLASKKSLPIRSNCICAISNRNSLVKALFKRSLIETQFNINANLMWCHLVFRSLPAYHSVSPLNI